MDFLLLAKFWACALFFYSPSKYIALFLAVALHKHEGMITYIFLNKNIMKKISKRFEGHIGDFVTLCMTHDYFLATSCL